jgi:uncharacterized protein YbaA (DUF1428 family)
MTKGTYVDGFVLTIPRSKAARYKKMAEDAKKVWRRFGALDYKECVIDDAKPKWVTFTFPKMAKPRAGEQVWFSYIVYKSRAHRDAVNTKVMAYFNKKYADKSKHQDMPFDMKRMAYAGFKVMVG